MFGLLDLIERLLTPRSGVSDEKIYTELCAEFRALNTIFWQIPLIVMTLNGGLWFAVASLDLTTSGQQLILAFTALINITFILALLRVRTIMEGLLKRIRTFEGRATTSDGWAGAILVMFWALMGIATIGAAVVAWNPTAYLKPKNADATVVVCQAGQKPPASPVNCRSVS